MIWGMPKDIRSRLLKRWDAGSLIRDLATGEIKFPYRLPLKVPSSSEMGSCFDEVRLWVLQLEKESREAGWHLERKNINHRQLGQNSLPRAMVFSDSRTLLAFLGKKKEYDLYLSLSEQLVSPFPVLKDWSLQNPRLLLQHAPVLDRLIRILQWIKDNPQPGIYLRQLSLEGVDTKFIEQHRSILMALLDRILDESNMDIRYKGAKNFEKRYGFLSRPELLRFRYPSPAPGGTGFTDLSVRADEFCRFEADVSRVFVIENDISALAFPPLSDSMVIFGRGYHFEPLAEADWLKRKELYYWGDLDTHGLAILAQFRQLFPHRKSFLMDQETLLKYKGFWGRENVPVKVLPASGLTREEHRLLRELLDNYYADNVRLEQEFIPFSAVEHCLANLDHLG